MFQEICQSENLNPVPRIRHSSSPPALPHIKHQVIARIMVSWAQLSGAEVSSKMAKICNINFWI